MDVLRSFRRNAVHVRQAPDALTAAELEDVARIGHRAPPGARSPYFENMFLTTNQTLAGRSASRRMYQGNQYSP
jgi:hypothetical protein